MRIVIELPDDTPLRLDRWAAFDDQTAHKVLALLCHDIDGSNPVFTSPLLERYLRDKNLTMSDADMYEIIERHMLGDMKKRGLIEDAGQCES